MHQNPSRKSREATSGEAASGPEWGLAGVALLALFAGGGLAFALGYGQASLASGLVSLFVLATAFSAPRGSAIRAAVAVSSITAAGLLLAQFGNGAPFAAGAAMAAVMFAAAIVRIAGPVAAAAGSILGTAYFLPAVLNLTAGFSSPDVLVLALTGLAVGLVLFAILSASGIGRNDEEEGPRADYAGGDPEQGGSLAAIRGEVTAFGPNVRYALRRALLLGLAMGLYQIEDSQNVFWVMLTIFVVLQPDRGATWEKSLKRGSGSIAGAIAVGMLAQVAPAGLVVASGIIALLIGLAYYRSNYAVFAAGVTVLTVAVIGDQGGNFAEWAVLRVADTTIGIAIAIVSVYVFLPDRTKPGRAEPQATEGASGKL
jgi:hypothetical protein